jgi:hypothetical protein
MLYVQQSLTPGEELVHVGHFHWIYTVHAMMGILWGVVGCVLIIGGAVYFQGHMGRGFNTASLVGEIQETNPAVRLGAFLVLILGLLHFARLMIIRATTEMAVTTSRIVYKRGVIARYTGEIGIDRVEGVNILQTALGRMLNYGRLMVHGMGIGEVILPPMADPITFRKAIEKARVT